MSYDGGREFIRVSGRCKIEAGDMLAIADKATMERKPQKKARCYTLNISSG
jgi:hypothetical protein